MRGFTTWGKVGLILEERLQEETAPGLRARVPWHEALGRHGLDGARGQCDLHTPGRGLWEHSPHAPSRRCSGPWNLQAVAPGVPSGLPGLRMYMLGGGLLRPNLNLRMTGGTRASGSLAGMGLGLDSRGCRRVGRRPHGEGLTTGFLNRTLPQLMP